jgi:hypothetical protein
LGDKALGDAAKVDEALVDDAFGDKALGNKAFGAGGRLTAADERAMDESLVEAHEQNKNIVAKSSRASQQKIHIAKGRALGRKRPKMEGFHEQADRRLRAVAPRRRDQHRRQRRALVRLL